MKSDAIRVLVGDDHPVVLAGLRSLLDAQPDITVVAAACNGEEAVELFRIHEPNVVVLDLRMPSKDGVEATKEILRQSPATKVIILTTLSGEEDIHRALQAGASTYLLKEALADDLVSAVRQVHAGERPVPKEVATKIVQRISQSKLTPREIEVLSLIARGERNKEVSASLGISEETVQVHVKSILAKLGVHDRTEAVTVALRRGILHLD